MSGSPPRVLDRYLVYDVIGQGGMAVIHIGRLMGAAGFGRTVAIKRLIDGRTDDPSFLAMLISEARVAARIHHANVVQTVDVVVDGGEIFLVMEYIHGDTLGRLLGLAGDDRVPPDMVSAMMVDTLRGLHAAHTALSETGEPLNVVHRDLSPHNVLVGVDGTARVADFGIAKALGQLQKTQAGTLKGKLAYMAPEQLEMMDVDQRTDIYAAGIVLWEALTGERLFKGVDGVAARLRPGAIAPPSTLVEDLSAEVDEVVLNATAVDPADRYGTAEAMAMALSHALPPAPAPSVARWVQGIAEEWLAERRALLSAMERRSSDDVKLVPRQRSASSLLNGMKELRDHVSAVATTRPDGPDESVTRVDAVAPSAVLEADDAVAASTAAGATDVTDSTLVSKVKGGVASRPLRTLVPLGLGFVVVGVVVGAVIFSNEGTQAASPLPGSASATGSALELGDAAASGAPSGAPITEATIAAGDTTTALPAGSDPSPSSAAPPAPPTKWPTAAPIRTTLPAAPNCTPPYVVGPDGVKRFKPECFK